MQISYSGTKANKLLGYQRNLLGYQRNLLGYQRNYAEVAKHLPSTATLNIKPLNSGEAIYKTITLGAMSKISKAEIEINTKGKNGDCSINDDNEDDLPILPDLGMSPPKK